MGTMKTIFVSLSLAGTSVNTDGGADPKSWILVARQKMCKVATE